MDTQTGKATRRPERQIAPAADLRTPSPGAGGGKVATRPSTRRVKLATSRIHPWSVLKASFLLSVAAGFTWVALVAALWLTLSATGAFTTIQTAIDDTVGSSSSRIVLMDYLGLGRVISVSTVIGVINLVLITAFSTLAAILYNVCSSLVGGLQLTLTDD
jgi:hypothetical protein